MKKKEILALGVVFNDLKKIGDTKFKYCILKNISVIKDTLTILQTIDKENKKVLEDFEKERNALIIKIGKREGDKSVIDLSNPEMVAKFNEELTKIAETHKEALEEFEKLATSYGSLLEEDVEEELKFWKISIDDCPKDGINATQLEILLEHEIIT